MRYLTSIFLLSLVAVTSSGNAEKSEPRNIMDQGQCKPYYDADSGFWGYDCQHSTDPNSRSGAQQVKITPQFSWASPFINGRARVLLGCRLASCLHEPKGRSYDRRLYVFISPDYDFEPQNPYDPEIWNPNHYTIYNEAFTHVGNFDQDYLGLACVAYQGSIAYVNREGNIVFAERPDGMVSVPSTPQLKKFLDSNRLEYATEGVVLFVEPLPKVMDYLLESFQPPPTPVTASFNSVR